MDFGNHLEHFSLRWNNFNDNMKIGFHDLLKTEDFVDVTIAAEGKLIQAHKMVLSVCSPYFRNIFKTNPCQHPVVFLKDVTYKELTGILQFVYLGEVNIQQEELGRFLKTAEALQIKGLTGTDSSENKKDEKMGDDETSDSSDRHAYQCSNKTKLVYSDISDRDTSSKKMKFGSANDISKVGVQNYTECSNNNNNSSGSSSSSSSNSNYNPSSRIIPKTEPVNDDLMTNVDSDRISLNDENVSESLLRMQDVNLDYKDDAGHTTPSSYNSSGIGDDSFTGVSTESIVMADGGQGLKYFPLLTKNQGLCPICGRILQHKKNLQTHIADQHSGIFRSWPCQICHKVCKTWSALRVHTNRHHTKGGSTALVDVPLPLN